MPNEKKMCFAAMDLACRHAASYQKGSSAWEGEKRNLVLGN